MLFDMELLEEVKKNYDLVNMLFIICMRKDLRLVFENPYSEEHFLRRYWCYLPAVIDRDRTERGDYFTKPTQYWFLNCNPSNNIIFEIINNNQIIGTGNGDDGWARHTKGDAIKWMKKGDAIKNLKTARSMIHPDYANRFIREFILNEEDI